MKPVPFDYERAQSLEAACQLLGDDEEAVIIAGGQTLIPMLAMRLARPSRLIDISRIAGLGDIDDRGGSVSIGCMTRHAEVEHSPIVAAKVPLLAAAMPWVGHAPIRVRGTIGGSIANADPSAEVPLVLVTLGGDVTLSSATGARTVPAREFFVGPMMTAIQPGECLSAAHFPVWDQPRTGIGFREIANRHGDFAMVAVAAQVALDGDGTCVACTVGIGGVVDTPMALTEFAASLVGSKLVDQELRGSAPVATQHLNAMGDPQATPAYRKRAAAKLIADALIAARDNALANNGAPTT